MWGIPHLLFVSRCSGSTIVDVLQWATMAASPQALQIELGTTVSASATTSKEAPWAGSTNTWPITLTLDANG